MSRIGKSPVVIPAGVTVDIADDTVTVKGAKGTLSQKVKEIDVKLEGEQVIFERPSDQKKHKAMHGLYRALVNNMVEGVSKGFKKELELVGVGFKASVKGKNVLELNLGYSHDIYFQLPEELTVEAKTEKGKNPIVTIEGIDKQLVGQIAAKLKSLRKTEPYKGKGVKFVGENIRRKAGKAGKK